MFRSFITYRQTPLAERSPCLVLSALVVVATALASGAWAERETISLDGTWSIADSREADAIPGEFAHTVPVPGLVNLAQPPFEDVDAFLSREQLANRIRRSSTNTAGSGSIATVRPRS
jgi:hypothetical protein